jgi:diguanylate cyclase (GGDEF)-like protein
MQDPTSAARLQTEAYTYFARMLSSLHAATDFPGLASRFEFVGERCVGAALSVLVLRDEGDVYRPVPGSGTTPSVVAAMWSTLQIDRLSQNNEAAAAFSQVVSQRLPRRFNLDAIFSETADAARGLVCDVTPLSFGGEFMGVGLFVIDPEAETAVFAPILSEHAAVAVQRLRLYEQARRLHGTDPALWIPDEAFFRSELRRELSRARRYGSQVGVALLRVDSVEKVRDRFGDFYAGHLLRRVGLHMTEAIRDTDALGALDGGFAVIQTGTSPEGTLISAERLCESVAKMLAHQFPELELSLIAQISATTANAPEDDTTLDGIIAKLLQPVGTERNARETAA